MHLDAQNYQSYVTVNSQKTFGTASLPDLERQKILPIPSVPVFEPSWNFRLRLFRGFRLRSIPDSKFIGLDILGTLDSGNSRKLRVNTIISASVVASCLAFLCLTFLNVLHSRRALNEAANLITSHRRMKEASVFITRVVLKQSPDFGHKSPRKLTVYTG